MPYKPAYSLNYRQSHKKIISDLIEFSINTASDFDIDLERQSSALFNLPFLYPEYEYNNELNLDKPLRKMVLTGYNYIVFYLVDKDKN